MALKQTNDSNKYCHIEKVQGIKISYMFRHCSQRELWRKQLQASFLAAPWDAKGALRLWLFSKTNFILCFPFHAATFCQAAHTFQAMFKASSRCRFKQTECAFEKKLNTVYFGRREWWNTQISQKFHILFTLSIPCIYPLFQLKHLLLMPLLWRLINFGNGSIFHNKVSNISSLPTNHSVLYKRNNKILPLSWVVRCIP